MKPIPAFKALLLAWLTALWVPASVEAADNVQDAIQVVRSTYTTDRQAFLAETLQLTESESAGFWPFYRAYRADVEKIGDGLVMLVLEYADLYPNVPEDRAARLLKQYMALEKKLVDRRAWHLKRAGKIMPAAKVLRWAQLENRMDLALRLQLAGAVPLVPVGRSRP